MTQRGCVYLIRKKIWEKGVFKIGCSTDTLNYDRIKSYGKKAQILALIEVNDCREVEKNLKLLFNSKFILIEGKEHFKGNEDQIKLEFLKIVYNYELNNSNKTTVDTVVKSKVDTVVDTVVDTKKVQLQGEQKAEEKKANPAGVRCWCAPMRLCRPGYCKTIPKLEGDVAHEQQINKKNVQKFRDKKRDETVMSCVNCLGWVVNGKCLCNLDVLEQCQFMDERKQVRAFRELNNKKVHYSKPTLDSRGCVQARITEEQMWEYNAEHNVGEDSICIFCLELCSTKSSCSDRYECIQGYYSYDRGNHSQEAVRLLYACDDCAHFDNDRLFEDHQILMMPDRREFIIDSIWRMND